MFFALLGLSGCFITCYDRRVRNDLAQPCRELCLCCCQPGVGADYHLPGILCMSTDCTACFESCGTITNSILTSTGQDEEDDGYPLDHPEKASASSCNPLTYRPDLHSMHACPNTRKGHPNTLHPKIASSMKKLRPQISKVAFFDSFSNNRDDQLHHSSTTWPLDDEIFIGYDLRLSSQCYESSFSFSVDLTE